MFCFSFLLLNDPFTKFIHTVKLFFVLFLSSTNKQITDTGTNTTEQRYSTDKRFSGTFIFVCLMAYFY